MNTPAIHVLFRKEELAKRSGAPERPRVAVVLDVLFATTTIVSVLEHGAAGVIPALHEAQARAYAGENPGALLAGELDTAPINGFAPPTPLALVNSGVHGRKVIYATTNGTVALRMAESVAGTVYAGSMRNGAAVAARVAELHPDATVLIVCAGSAGRFNLEDFYGAGHVIDRLLRVAPGRRPTDAALAALELYRRWDPLECLLKAHIGRVMAGAGLEEEVRYAAQRDVTDVVPVLSGGRLVLDVAM